jgi:putative membrane protein
MLSTLDRRFAVFNAVVSAIAVTFLFWLLFLHKGTAGSADLRFMPAVNASFNAAAAVLLASGWVAIRRGHREIHKRLMVSAFACSALFLIGYVAYHAVHGDTKYPGAGWVKTVYLVILASHVLLSMSVVPLALTCFWLAYRENFQTHKKFARWAMPIWLYVSVTGVVIYFFLRDAVPARP